MPPEALAACGLPLDNCTTEPGGDCGGYPSALFNTMVNPVVGRGVRAWLWMQGEANSDEPRLKSVGVTGGGTKAASGPAAGVAVGGGAGVQAPA